MDKLTRTVTIMIAIVIAVSAVLLAFFLTRSNEQKAESSSSVDTDEKATLVSPSIEHVQSMTITNQPALSHCYSCRFLLYHCNTPSDALLYQ